MTDSNKTLTDSKSGQGDSPASPLPALALPSAATDVLAATGAARDDAGLLPALGAAGGSGSRLSRGDAAGNNRK